MTKRDTLLHKQLLNTLLIKFKLTVDNTLINVNKSPESQFGNLGKPTNKGNLQKKRNNLIS